MADDIGRTRTRPPRGGVWTGPLSEGDGCEDWVEEGHEMRVRYDPEGIAGPTEDTGDRDSGSDGTLLASLFGAAVVMGTWGGVRQSRWDREYGVA
ncbi:hypothetical protein [Streptomyces parvulus]|uniref:hypothetical protein n=1 Tax=Streptomyces parvulus TaxID=146923 RepID=UPI00341C8B42